MFPLNQLCGLARVRPLMKGATCLCLLWAGLLAAHAQGAASRFERFSFSGQAYVRLEDWARSQNLQVRWVVPKEQVKVIGSGTTLVFWADSRKMSLNGVHVWLASPVVMKTGAAYIGAVDLATAIHPLLYPVRNSPGKSIRTICLDPGHGGKDPGNREGRQFEKHYTLLLAEQLSDQLRRAGFMVLLTRTSDRFADLSERTEAARRRNADLFVSLHLNSADGPGGSSVKGTEVYCLTPAHTSSTNARGEGAETGNCPGNRFDAKNITLAYRVQRALLARLGTEDRGVRRARFAVLRNAEMPAVLVEGGFMTHPAESRKLYDTAYRRQMAAAIVEGIQAYKKTVER
jgi:N-acetylmuramoyl-L-alanine amidase